MVFLFSFMRTILLLANPAHAKRHGQGTHFFILVKGEVVGRLAWDLSPTTLHNIPCEQNPYKKKIINFKH
jgi:hypothetical protein